MLLAYREDPSFFAVGRALRVHHQTVQRCVERALAYGPMAALDDRPRPGKEPTITGPNPFPRRGLSNAGQRKNFECIRLSLWAIRVGAHLDTALVAGAQTMSRVGFA